MADPDEWLTDAEANLIFWGTEVEPVTTRPLTFTWNRADNLRSNLERVRSTLIEEVAHNPGGMLTTADMMALIDNLLNASDIEGGKP